MCLCMWWKWGSAVVLQWFTTVWQTSLGDREIPGIYLWFCCKYVGLNLEVLPPGRAPTNTIPLSDVLSEMRKEKRRCRIQEHFGPHQKIVTAPKLCFHLITFTETCPLQKWKKKNLAPKCKYRSEQKVGKYIVEYLNVATLLLESLWVCNKMLERQGPDKRNKSLMYVNSVMYMKT